MTFSTCTIQGYVGYIGEAKQIPDSKRVVLNILVNVPNKRNKEEKEYQTYKVSVWDKQALSGTQYLKKGQVITVQGQLTIDKYEPKMLRLDFANILDYGNTYEERIAMAEEYSKRSSNTTQEKFSKEKTAA